MIEKINGKKVLNMFCHCGAKHCYGELNIQPDLVKGEHIFWVRVVDSNGNEEGNMLLSKDQIEQLIEELKIIKEEK